MLAQSSTKATNAYKQTSQRNTLGQTDQEIERLRLEVDRAKTLQGIQDTPVKAELESVKESDFVEMGDVAGASTAAP
jgi:hypothetical protein